MTIIPDPRDLEFVFIRASGPGGQNVNKVSSAVQLRFDTRGFAPFDAAARERLTRLAGRRLNADGVLILEAQRFRTQERNRTDALARLAALLEAASTAPRPRRPTRSTRASRERRARRQAAAGRRKAPAPQTADRLNARPEGPGELQDARSLTTGRERARS